MKVDVGFCKPTPHSEEGFHRLSNTFPDRLQRLHERRTKQKSLLQPFVAVFCVFSVANLAFLSCHDDFVKALKRFGSDPRSKSWGGMHRSFRLCGRRELPVDLSCGLVVVIDPLATAALSDRLHESRKWTSIIVSLKAARELSISELLRVLDEKLGTGCSRVREIPLPPVVSATERELEVRATRYPGRSCGI